jgi:hypothetical protein
VAAVTVSVSAQEAPPTTSPAEAAAGWLARQLVDGERLQSSFTDPDTGELVAFDDTGLTLDAVLAFAAAGVADDAGANAIAWVGRSDVLEAYIGDGTDVAWAGATAKVALGALVRGLDPRSFGDDGVDLIERLLARDGGDGRFSDTSEFGDFSNTFSQSLAILALHRAPAVSPSAAAIDVLLGAGCPDGGFADALEPQPCTSQVDATALAVQALLAVGHPAAEAGLDWLAAQQTADGRIGGNANSTGLAAQALAVAERPEASAAVEALVGLQAGCDAPLEDRGAVAFDDAGVDDTAVRATAQAVLGLAGTGFATISSAGASPAVPSLDCPTPVDAPAGTPHETPTPTGPAVAPVGATPAAPVARATPTFVG